MTALAETACEDSLICYTSSINRDGFQGYPVVDPMRVQGVDQEGELTRPRTCAQ